MYAALLDTTLLWPIKFKCTSRLPTNWMLCFPASCTAPHPSCAANLPALFNTTHWHRVTTVISQQAAAYMPSCRSQSLYQYVNATRSGHKPYQTYYRHACAARTDQKILPNLLSKVLQECVTLTEITHAARESTVDLAPASDHFASHLCQQADRISHREHVQDGLLSRHARVV